MSVKMLDCTLRDGGYINDWDFSPNQIASTVANLTNAGIEYIEFGYLTSIFSDVNGSRFQDVGNASESLPPARKRSKYLLMADVSQFDPNTLCRRTAETIDGIRVVFYKRQTEQAVSFCQKIVEMGYDLFVQPMVTVDYSVHEFEELTKRFCELYHPYAVSIVDSFGCMTRKELMSYIQILDKHSSKDIGIGFHGHDNMRLAQSNAISLFECETERELIVDVSVSGMGRGAGNLHTELLVNHVNQDYGGNYGLEYIIPIVSEVTEPISRIANWGYSPYFMLTALRKAHPNFATHLLSHHDISVNDFQDFLLLIPDDMLTKCTRPYVEEVYQKFSERNVSK